MLEVGQSVDVFVTVSVIVPNDPNGKYMSDRSTKVTYQDMTILAKKDQFYVVRAPVEIAEEIEHLQATGAATFSLALRPVEDQRQVDATDLGETTTSIIEKYGLPIPKPLIPGFTPAPTPTLSPAPSGDPASSAAPGASPGPSASAGAAQASTPPLGAIAPSPVP